jgi:hypothetical protein
MCVCIVRQSWADGGAEAELREKKELHGRAVALAVSNVGDDPAAAPLELEIRDRRWAQGAAVAPVEHARADAFFFPRSLYTLGKAYACKAGSECDSVWASAPEIGATPPPVRR